jgi:RHS repeat-associated protein
MTRLLLTFVALFWIAAAAQAQEVVEYYHTDALGSVRAVTAQSGAVIARHDYLPFGEEYLPQAGSDPRRFAGKERDAETGLDYFDARYYRSATGRFTTVDPGQANGNIFDPQSWNAYGYARNNQLRFTDPTGTTYQICPNGGTCQSVSDRYFGYLEDHPGSGISLRNGVIFATVNGNQVVAGSYEQTSVDLTFATMLQQAGNSAADRIKQGVSEMAVGAAVAAGGGLIAGALSGGLAAESLSVTGRLAPLNYGKNVDKFARQMAARGWTDGMIREAVSSGQKFQTINKATGNPAIRYVHPRTGQSVVVDTVTKRIIHVGGPGFLY